MNRRPSAARSQVVDFSETDLNKLQHQYRKAKRAKSAYTAKTKAIISRDKQEIQRLQDEHEELSCCLKVSQSCFNSRTDACVVQDISVLLASEDTVDVELVAEKDKLESLKYQIFEWERKLAELRTIRGTTHDKSDKSDNKLLKNTRHIENKLHRARQCLNTLMTRNGELKEDLYTLQIEQKQFLHVKSMLEKELREIQMNISRLMTKCSGAFNDSAKNQEKQTVLLNQNVKDVAQYIKERLKLERKISQYCNVEAFLDTKDSARINKDIVYRNEKKFKQLDSKELGLEDFEDAITKILSETQERDLDKLVRDFLQMEEQNYTLMNFINHQHNAAESIQQQISQIRSEMDVFEAEEKQQHERHHALRLRLSIQQEATEQQLAVYQKNAEVTENLIDLLKKGLKSMLQICYDSSVICDQLGSSDGVQDENITQCLRLMEDRVNELVTLQSYFHFQNNLNQWDTFGLSTIEVQLPGITPKVVKVTTAAAKPIPCHDPNLTETVLLEAKEPMSREALLTLVSKRIHKKKKTD